VCGIFGYVLSGPQEGQARPSLDRAVARLRHRGPDGDGVFLDEGAVTCGLAHTRLAIIDLSPGGKQPMSSDDARYTITFNGEIYNYRELRAELEAVGDRFRSHSDTEVLVVGYRRWGKDLVSKLRGMFSFAIWDAAERRLFLARDRLGVKPLYLARVNGGCLFASEVRALLDTNLVRRRLSRDGLASYLAFGSVREPASIVEGVTLLPSGAFAELHNSTLRIANYWTPPLRLDRSVSRDAATREVASLLRESVSLRLVADVPVGVFLSGGLDSSALVALATSASASRIHTFTVTFDEAAYDEAREAQAVAGRFGAEHHPIRLSAERALNEMDQALDALDQPSADGINTYFVSKAVREVGVTVALSGIGGDELFAGYPAFRAFAVTQRLAPLLRHLPFRPGDRPWPDVSAGTRKALSTLSSRGDPFTVYSILRAMFLPAQIARLLRVAAYGAPPPTELDGRISAWGTGPSGDAIAAYSAFELTNYLRNTLLRDMDVMGMAHGLEIREPLLDHRLVERILTLPGGWKLSRQRKKPLLVDSVPSLPRATTRGPKMGFTLPFQTWLAGPLRRWAEEQLREPDILSQAEIHRLWAAFDRGKLTYSRIWTLIALLDWMRRNRVELPD
jgi:asparagine synthase (glutamine-hydrolysing)